MRHRAHRSNAGLPEYAPENLDGLGLSRLWNQADISDGDFIFEYGVGHPMMIYVVERSKLARLPFSRQQSETVGAMQKVIEAEARRRDQESGVVFELRDGGRSSTAKNDLRQVGNIVRQGYGMSTVPKVVWSPSRSKNQRGALDSAKIKRALAYVHYWEARERGAGRQDRKEAAEYAIRNQGLNASEADVLRRALHVHETRASNPKRKDDFRYVKRERPTLAVLERDARVRWEQKYKVGEPGSVYEFNVKLPRIPGASFNDEDLYIETKLALDAFKDILTHDFPWVGKMYFTGRSGGWLAIEDKQGKATATSILAIADRVDDALDEFVKYMEEEYS